MSQSNSACYVYGKNSVKAVLENRPEQVFKIFIAEGLKPDKRLEAIQTQAHQRKIPMQTVPRTRLDQMLKSQQLEAQGASGKTSESGTGEQGLTDQGVTHQGIMASVAPKKLWQLPALIQHTKAQVQEGQHPRLLMLDGITDPRNFGAILRVADAAGIQGVIIPKQHSAGFGPVVSKTASGAEESVNVAVVSNLNQAIQQLKDSQFWIVGAALNEKAVDYHKQDYQMPLVLVMGSEGKGLAPLVQKNCDFLIKIPMFGTVDSLNVSAATAVLLFEMVKRP